MSSKQSVSFSSLLLRLLSHPFLLYILQTVTIFFSKMVFGGVFSLFVGVALVRWGKCQSFPGNVNAGNPVNTGNYGNGGNYGSVGTGSFVPANQRNCAVVSVKAQPMFDMKSFAGN